MDKCEGPCLTPLSEIHTRGLGRMSRCFKTLLPAPLITHPKDSMLPNTAEEYVKASCLACTQIGSSSRSCAEDNQSQQGEGRTRTLVSKGLPFSLSSGESEGIRAVTALLTKFWGRKRNVGGHKERRERGVRGKRRPRKKTLP